MSIKRQHRFHISRLLTLAFLIELSLFPHTGYAGIETGLLMPSSSVIQARANMASSLPAVARREVQAFPHAGNIMPKATRRVVITAYSSTPDQTDDTPFITANGTHVRDGIIAANFLKFNTQVKIPELYGDKVFSVTDRMHERFSNRVDVWMGSREEAVQFGVKVATIEVY